MTGSTFLNVRVYPPKLESIETNLIKSTGVMVKWENLKLYICLWHNLNYFNFFFSLPCYFNFCLQTFQLVDFPAPFPCLKRGGCLYFLLDWEVSEFLLLLLLLCSKKDQNGQALHSFSPDAIVSPELPWLLPTPS